MKGDLQPHLLCSKEDIARYVLMPGDPNRVLRIGEQLDDYREIAYNREFRVITGSYEGVPVTACSTGIGGPSTAIAIEELAKLGSEIVVRVGSCGGYQQDVKIGDLVIPEAVVRANDGTSKAYVPQSYPAVPSPEVFNALVKAAEELDIQYHRGVSTSTDAFYLKSKEFVKFWNEKGIIACEMEAATFLVVSGLRNLKAAAVFVAVNELADAEEPWVGVRKYAVQAKEKRKDEEVLGEEKAILTALNAIQHLDSTNSEKESQRIR